MTRSHETRKGFTLTEVLMAMFVMAIGMLSLLALFPVAFHNARWALDTEQVARGAANAQSTTEMPHVPVGGQVLAGNFISTVANTAQNVRNDSFYKPSLAANTIYTSPVDMSFGLGRRDFLADMFSAGGPHWTYSRNLNYLTHPQSATARVKLPPVFVDPQVANDFFDTTNGTNLPISVGCMTPLTSPFAAIAGTLPSIDVATLRPRWSVGIPRASVTHLAPVFDPLKLTKQLETTMGDEIDFGPNGQPLLNTASQYARQRRFTWAYMCHWPDYANTEICEVTAVVFNSRPGNSGLATLPPGEKTYEGHRSASNNLGSGIDALSFGRIFVKGLNQATIHLGTTPSPMPLKVNDWILDSTLILPEYNPAFPLVTVPFLDEYLPATYLTAGGPDLRPGLVGGHFYKVLDVSEVRQHPGGYFQTITLDRPAKSDGFSATIMSGIADVITKGAGKMPQR